MIKPFKPLLPITSILLEQRHLKDLPSFEYPELSDELNEWCEGNLTKGWRFFHLCCTMPSAIPGGTHINATYDMTFPILDVLYKRDVIAFKLRWSD